MFNINLVPKTGILDQIFHQTWLSVSILGHPAEGYKINLIGLILVTILAFAVNGITERLTSRKAGGMLVAVLVTLLGAYLVSAYVRLPVEVTIEGVRMIAALLGAVVIAVFYNLLTGRASRKPA
jgi:uncharacterized protein YqgC (DUF456 family)